MKEHITTTTASEAKSNTSNNQPRIPSRDEFHRTFGGIITQWHFSDNYSGTLDMADKIARDFEFDQRCKKNIILREIASQNKKNMNRGTN